MGTLSKLGYSVRAFEAIVASGRFFTTGLNLLSGSPEGSCLFDPFGIYIGTPDFAPRMKTILAELKAALKQDATSDFLTAWS
jgi:hypothetical protein